MSKISHVFGTWGARIGILAAALVTVSIVGGPLYMTAKGTPLHRDPESAPSVTEVNTPAAHSEATARARRLVRAALVEGNLPGVSVAVGLGRQLVWAEGFGWADIDTRAPVTPATQFWIGGTSTVLTSAAVGVLLEKGRLRLDDEIQTYVPQLPRTRSRLTLRQLMGQPSGITADSSDERPLSYHRCERPADALQHLAGRELPFEPGTPHAEPAYGWILVSAAVEAASRAPFLTFMREQVFGPLRLEHTNADSATEENPERVGEPEEDAPPLTLIREVILEPIGIARRKGTPSPDGRQRATFYSPGFGLRPAFRYGLHVRHPRNLSCYAGAMAFLSTPSDLVRFGLGLNSGRFLQPDTIRSLQMAQGAASAETSYALGWNLQAVTLGGVRTQAVGGSGNLSGGMVSFMIFPETGLAVAVMANTSSADTAALALRVAEAFATSAR